MTDVADLTEPAVVSADELLADALRPPDAPTDDADAGGRPWEVDGPRTADWALLKIRAAHARYVDDTAGAREQKRVLEERIAELDEHIARAGERRDRTVGFFEAKLIDWFRRQRRDAIAAGEDPDKAPKSRPLTGGAVTSRAGQDRVEVVDAAAVVRWGETLVDADVARWEPKVDRRAVARWIAATGEVPPGVEYVRATEDDRSYSVRVES